MSSLKGILIVGHDRKVLHADGLGSDGRVQALATDTSWMEEARTRRLQPLTLDHKSYSVLVLPFAKGDILLLTDIREPVLEFLSSVDFAYDIVEKLLTDPFDAMTVVDANARLVYISPVHEAFFGLKHGEGNGRPVRQVIENTRLDTVVSTGRSEVGHIQRMKGVERVVSRVPIVRDDKILGAVGRVMFKGPEQLMALSERIAALESEVEFRRREVAALRRRTYGLDDLIGESEPMKRLKNEIVKIAPLEIPVLIRGESGTGKELVAHALHLLSPRRDNAMVMVNAAALPATLVESELFGYEAGAFTGADRKGRKGRFEQAANGTIFLDEIGDMPLDVQVKLLRVLQDRVVERIGGDRPRHVDFRLVTATNRDLQVLISEEKFRLDLYYRISPLVIEVPPLRNRIEDIRHLVGHFLDDVSQLHGRPTPRISAGALAYLMELPWPGNVRQLRHEVERAFVFADDGIITPETFIRHGDLRFAGPSVALKKPLSLEGGRLKDIVERTEIEVVREAMQRYGGNKKRVAEELGISRSYLYKLLGEPE
ncbi:sigma-54 interaction domain-containing protein [Aminobacter aminovorans]|jgi:transcriptional regulator with PAS, ATPase and Fis domain|uniref:Sigma54 specific transcriptional regulator, Fis family n=1 Tax=Aminobacter aminovorans TaxID=83263 RepID=A0AAC8YVL5_AMIAI|nr:sigma 54-interacting transcriptional regulator [Aminobacter aminovorans]AMS45277.1 Sigma54 specific transcriptional regulator, Fis family [Aminobacter aminovorans]MBB3704958.1 transcriptional regulator with PAS, ATPase and Fis domain [Aminobacter aminovorans]